MENPVMSNHVDVTQSLHEPDNDCIVQADEEPSMSGGAVENPESNLQGGPNSSWYWTSMLKLMEQAGAAGGNPTSNSSCSTNENPSTYGGQLSTIGQYPAGGISHATASPTSSSVHDQPMENLLTNHIGSAAAAINATNDPDGAVWAQEFLSGPICESKHNMDDHLACSDDGLHELLYPRTVLELLFSDQLKLEQWPENRGFALSPAAAHQTQHVEQQLSQLKQAAAADIQPNIHLNAGAATVHYPTTYAQFDDRLSSSTASSTLSDTTIEQWAAPTNPTAGQCEHMHGRSSSALHLPAPIQQQQAHQLQFDSTRVKMEYPAVTSPSYYNISSDILANNINTASYTKLSNPFLHSHNPRAADTIVNDQSMIINEIEAKPSHGQLAANKLWPPPNADHHPRFINTNSTRNHLNYDQLIPAQVAERFVNTQQQANQLGKKSRLEAIKREAIESMVHDTKSNVNIPSGGNIEDQKMSVSSEHNFKRPRVDQASSTPLKSQPVRKEKLTERITTLQQLVSPFGKTDTASVLLEAIGYIKFLQEQVQALSSPYFKSGTSQIGEKNSGGDQEAKTDLRSRGLCLVPLSCTMQVANDNGADYWYGGAFR